MAISMQSYDENGQAIIETTHVGLVLGTGEHNFYDDSDFYAVVWDPVKKKTQEVEYATTRAWTYNNHAEVDFDEDLYGADYRAYVLQRATAAAIAEYSSLRGNVSDIGRVVKVVRGRKIPLGTVGKVVAVWVNPYDAHNQQYLLEVDKKRVQTYKKNIEIVATSDELENIRNKYNFPKLDI